MPLPLDPARSARRDRGRGSGPARRSFLHKLSIHSRLSLLLLLVAIPFVALLINDTVQQYRSLSRGIQEQVLQLARLAASNQNQVIEHTRQLLEALAKDARISAGDWPGCRAMLPDFLVHFRDSHSNFVVADLRGEVVCSGVPLGTGVNISDIKDFQEVVATRRFVVGDLVLARTTRTWVVLLRAPVLSPDGRVIATVSAPVPVERFAAAAAAVALPEGGELLIVDRAGKLVARRPDPQRTSGEGVTVAPLVRAMLDQPQGVAQFDGVDGVRRTYGFAAAGHQGGRGIHVAIGMPLAAVASTLNRQLAANIAVVIAVTLGVFALATYSVRRIVSSQLTAIVDAANRLRRGDTSARTGLRGDRGELNRLGETLDLMAQGLQARESELNQALRELQEQVITDPLTRLLNRRYLREYLPRELIRAKRNRGSLAVVLIDIDHFKRINDTFGHEAGDLVLRTLGARLKDGVRASDIACRFGGEEFVVVLLDAAPEGARQKAEAMRAAVGKLDLNYRGESLGRITASMGVALYPDHADDADSLLRAADEALYRAKVSGRDRVVMSETTGGKRDTSEPASNSPQG